MIRTILVDDEPRALNTIKKIIQDYCSELRVIAECCDADEAKKTIELLQPQLVFLDVSLSGKTGFDLLSELDEINFKIIFVTAYDEYTLQALHYSAVDYLLKPIDEDLFIEAVKRAEKRISINEVTNNISTLLHNFQKVQAPRERKLCIPSLKGFQVVDLKDVLFCEASGCYTNFHFSDKQTICTAKTILDYEELLKDAGFIRIHKSFLVNLQHVKEYLRGDGGSVILSNGTEVEVARRKKDVFMSKMKEYYKY